MIEVDSERDLENQLDALEILSKKLEPKREERLNVSELFQSYSHDFLDTVNEHTYYGKQEEMKSSNAFEISEDGKQPEELVEILKSYVDVNGLNPASHGHLGYIPGGGLYYSAVGDYLADVTNRYAGIYYASPGAVKMENELIKWTAQKLGFPEGCAGNLASGGSIANLIAICAAREAKKITSKTVSKTVIYCSNHQHHCLEKAIKISGLHEAVIRYVDLDEFYKIDAKKLEKQIESDIEDGLIPSILIASAGTTNVGAIDPLVSLGEISKKHKLWYHIDGAYGGFFALCEEGKRRLKGIELGDSVVVDPHKGMFLPYGLGIVLVKHTKALKDAFSFDADYMQDASSPLGEISPAEVSPELTKHFRGLRMWLPLQLHGEEPFIACTQEKLLLTQYFYREIKKIENIEVGPEPELSVTYFRFLPEKGDANAFNKQLIEEIQKDGRVFLSSTLIDGKFVIRLACLSFRTHKDTIDLTLQIIKEKLRCLKG